MTNTETRQELYDALEVLPPDLRRAVTRISLPETLFVIGRTHGLEIDKIGLLGELVLEFILGLVAPETFKEELMERLDLDAEMGNRITRAANSSIFRPIREHLKTSLETKAQQEKPSGAPAVARPAPPLTPQPAAPQTTTPSPSPVIPPRKLEPLIIRPLRREAPQAAPPRPIPTPLKGNGLPEPNVAPKPEIKPSPAPPPPAGTRLEPLIISPLGRKPQVLGTSGQALDEKNEALGTRDEARGEADEETVPKPTPGPNLPQEKIPKPEAPERYATDPYKEPVE